MNCFGGGGEDATSNNPLQLGGGPDADPDSGMFVRISCRPGTT